MIHVLLVGLGGSLGAIARYGLTLWLHAQLGTSFPWSPAFINIGGSFLIGLLMTYGVEIAPFSPEAKSFLVTGIIGGLTTYAAFTYESARLIHTHGLLTLAGYVVMNVVLGLAAVFLGAHAARMLG